MARFQHTNIQIAGFIPCYFLYDYEYMTSLQKAAPQDNITRFHTQKRR